MRVPSGCTTIAQFIQERTAELGFEDDAYEELLTLLEAGERTAVAVNPSTGRMVDLMTDRWRRADAMQTLREGRLWQRGRVRTVYSSWIHSDRPPERGPDKYADVFLKNADDASRSDPEPTTGDLKLGEPASAVIYRTGAPGRPTSTDLVIGELHARIADGQLEPTLAKQAQALSAWLAERHPQAAQLKPTSMENAIRNVWRGNGLGKPIKTNANG